MLLKCVVGILIITSPTKKSKFEVLRTIYCDRFLCNA